MAKLKFSKQSYVVLSGGKGRCTTSILTTQLRRLRAQSVFPTQAKPPRKKRKKGENCMAGWKTWERSRGLCPAPLQTLHTLQVLLHRRAGPDFHPAGRSNPSDAHTSWPSRTPSTAYRLSLRRRAIAAPGQASIRRSVTLATLCRPGTGGVNRAGKDRPTVASPTSYLPSTSCTDRGRLLH